MSDEYVPEHRAADSEEEPKQLLSNTLYDRMKFVAVILLPAIGTLYFGLAGIWGLPKAEEVVGSIVVIDTFLGVALQISNKQYQNSDARFDGAIHVKPGEDEDTTNLNVRLDPAAVADKDEIVVKVNRDGV